MVTSRLLALLSSLLESSSNMLVGLNWSLDKSIVLSVSSRRFTHCSCLKDVVSISDSLLRDSSNKSTTSFLISGDFGFSVSISDLRWPTSARQMFLFKTMFIFSKHFPLSSKQITLFSKEMFLFKTNVSFQNKCFISKQMFHFKTNVSFQNKCFISKQMFLYKTNGSFQNNVYLFETLCSFFKTNYTLFKRNVSFQKKCFISKQMFHFKTNVSFQNKCFISKQMFSFQNKCFLLYHESYTTC